MPGACRSELPAVVAARQGRALASVGATRPHGAGAPGPVAAGCLAVAPRWVVERPAVTGRGRVGSMPAAPRGVVARSPEAAVHARSAAAAGGEAAGVVVAVGRAAEVAAPEEAAAVTGDGPVGPVAGCPVAFPPDRAVAVVVAAGGDPPGSAVKAAVAAARPSRPRGVARCRRRSGTCRGRRAGR